MPNGESRSDGGRAQDVFFVVSLSAIMKCSNLLLILVWNLTDDVIH